MDEMLDSSWDAGSKAVETWSEWREDVINLSDDKDLLKVTRFLIECKKIVSKFNFFSRKDLVFKAGISVNYSIDGAARISVKEGMWGFTLKLDTSLNSEWLGGTKQGLLDVFLRGE